MADARQGRIFIRRPWKPDDIDPTGEAAFPFRMAARDAGGKRKKPAAAGFEW
jgi:hypothetical protein